MESLENSLKKIGSLVAFASRDSYNHLAQIKNLEMVMISLLSRMKDEIKAEKPQVLQNQLQDINNVLLNLFINYDSFTQQNKKECLSKATLLLAELNTLIMKTSAQNHKSGESLSDENVRNDTNVLLQPVQSILGIGPRIASLLEKKNIFTIEDLLYFLPRRYEDRRSVNRIADTLLGIRQTIIGRIAKSGTRFWGRRKIFNIVVDDGSGILKAVWFKGNEAHLRCVLKPEARVILTGKITGLPFEREMIHPDFEILNDQDDQLLHFKRIVPLYSETEGLHQKTLRRILWKAVRDFSRHVQSPIPEEICQKRELIEVQAALRQAHFPENDPQPYMEMRSEAHRRLIYDEFFFFQLGMALRKRGEVHETGISFNTHGEMLKQFYSVLPFTLTSAQKRAIMEIENDMSSTRCMRRLLQGDVGSGKTVVAMAAMVTACENGYQAAMMAPTEILAEQHYRNLKDLRDKLGIKITLLTGSMKPSGKKSILKTIENGGFDLIVGTHALIQTGVAYHNLGLVVIDEQHRFGVVQRAMLREKGHIPDILVMTATPIPRTLAMTVYGDLDVSVIDEGIPGKIPIRTKVFTESQRTRVYEIIRREIRKGNQIFIVYPLVEESANLDLKDATRMTAHLRSEIFPDCLVALIHGRMSGNEKDRVMTDFSEKRIHILVATTVIEVGIDIPQASLMVIEHAERFGLSQLHQLRGRVGRGETPSFCILMRQNEGTADAHKRLRILEQTNDGFRIAEEDLAIRGPGEFMGTRQSGLPDFHIASIIRDTRILEEAKSDAFNLIDKDPGLASPDHQALRDVLFQKWGSKLELAKTG